MDYLIWCHTILAVLNDEKHNPLLTPLGIGRKLYGEDLPRVHGDFWSGIHGRALLHSLNDLHLLGLVSERHSFRDITLKGQQVLADPHSYWEDICLIEIDQDAQKMLQFINRDSQKFHDGLTCVEISMIERNQILAHYDLPLPKNWSDLPHNYVRVLIHTPYILYKLGLAKIHGGLHDCTSRGLSASYQGIVWETRRGETLETKFLDDLIDEWETNTVEFKQDLHLDNKPNRAEFAKDVLALANTKASGQRFLIIGFDNEMQKYFAAPDPKITQERIEQILKQYSAPPVRVRYDVVAHRDGKVGKLEVFRDKFNLPYRATETVESQPKRKTHLKAGVVYVRSNSLVTEADDTEVKRLQEEGDRARTAEQR